MNNAVAKGRVGDPCPACGQPLVARFRRSDGLPFLGCSRFPDCRGARDFILGAAPPAALPRGAPGKPVGFWETEEYRRFEAGRRVRRPGTARLDRSSRTAGIRRWLAGWLARLRA